MSDNKKLLSTIFGAALLISTSILTTASAGSLLEENKQQMSGATMVADALMVRPIALLGTVVGTATFVVSLPFSLLGNNTKEAGNYLVRDPFNYTFQRKLGDI